MRFTNGQLLGLLRDLGLSAAISGGASRAGDAAAGAGAAAQHTLHRGDRASLGQLLKSWKDKCSNAKKTTHQPNKTIPQMLRWPNDSVMEGD